VSQPTLPPLPARPSDPLAALADYLDPPEPGAYIEVGLPAAAAIVAEVLAARAVVDNARFVGREDLDETGVAERLADAVDAYDHATGARGLAPVATGTGGVLVAVAAERARQDARWGEQNVIYRSLADALAVLVEEVGEVARAVCEHDPAAVRAEAVQVAAVAVALVEGIDRAQAASPRAVARCPPRPWPPPAPTATASTPGRGVPIRA